MYAFTQVINHYSHPFLVAGITRFGESPIQGNLQDHQPAEKNGRMPTGIWVRMSRTFDG